MLRPLDIIMIGLLLGGAAFTFKVKHDSEVALERVAKLEKKIRDEQDAIDVLNADWSLLNDPKRLAKLAERYKDQLGVEETPSTAIGSVEEIVIRPPQLPQNAEDGISALLEGEDVTTTGAITNDGAGAREGGQ